MFALVPYDKGRKDGQSEQKFETYKNVPMTIKLNVDELSVELYTHFI